MNWKDYQRVEAPSDWIQAAQRLEAEPQRKRKCRHVLRPVLVCADMLLFCVGGAAAAGGLFDRVQNPTVVSSQEEMAADVAEKESQSSEEEESEPAIIASYDTPNSTEAFTLEETIENSRFKSNGWDSEDTMGGQVSIRSIEWVSMEVLNNEGPLKSRVVYDNIGGSKTEYTAEDPALLEEVQEGPLYWSISALNELYTPISYGNSYYVEHDENGDYVASRLSASYQIDDTHWITVDYDYHSDYANEGDTDYVIEEYYDAVETYTNSSGYEFIIKTYGNQLWADYQGTYSYASIYSNNPDIEAAKEILDNIVITERE